MEQKLNSIPPDGAAAQKQYEAEFSKSSQTIRQTPCYTPCICPDCGGTGIIVDYVAVCCLNPDEDGNCCNCPIPEPIQAQCCRCEATGYLRSVGIAFNDRALRWQGI